MFYIAPPMDKTGLPPTLKTSKRYMEFLKTKVFLSEHPNRWMVCHHYL